MLQYEISPPKLAWMTNSINRLWHAYGSGVCGRAEAFIHAPTPCVTIICGRYCADSPPASLNTPVIAIYSPGVVASIQGQENIQ